MYNSTKKNEKEHFFIDSMIIDMLCDLTETELNTIKNNASIYITTIQNKQIDAIKDKVKRNKLKSIIKELHIKIIPIADKGIWNEGLIWNDLCMPWSTPKTKEFNDINISDKHDADAYITNEAVRSNIILVTEDKRLLKKLKKKGSNFEDFYKRICISKNTMKQK